LFAKLILTCVKRLPFKFVHFLLKFVVSSFVWRSQRCYWLFRVGIEEVGGKLAILLRTVYVLWEILCGYWNNAGLAEISDVFLLNALIGEISSLSIHFR